MKPTQSRMLIDIADLKSRTQMLVASNKMLVDNSKMLVDNNKHLRTINGSLRQENRLFRESLTAMEHRLDAMERMGFRLMVVTGLQYGQKDTWTRGWNVDTGRVREVDPGEANSNETEKTTAVEGQKTE